MRNVTTRESNPFGLAPPCDCFVPGYGDANAHFHVVGDHPGIHGGVETGIPFTEVDASRRLQTTLVEGGLLREAGAPPVVDETFLSYLYTCVPEGEEPTPEEYADMERFFDAELRAITAHVVLPVGDRVTRHVLANMSARSPDVDMAALHASEVSGSGWLILPIRDPATWTDGDEAALVTALSDLLSRDYRREADLGRFLPGEDAYRVR